MINFIDRCYRGDDPHSSINSASGLKKVIAAINVTYQMCGLPDVHTDYRFRKFREALMMRMPIEPKYDDFWETEDVLKYIQTTWPDNKKLSTKDLRSKVIALQKLYTFGRTADLTAMFKEKVKITRKKDVKKVRFCLGNLKTSKNQSTGETRAWSTYATIESPRRPGLEALCYPSALEEYMDRIAKVNVNYKATFAGNIMYEQFHHVFVSINKQPRTHIAVKSATIASDFKRTLAAAGVDVTKYKPHSSRGASTTGYIKNGGDPGVAQKKGRWKSSAVMNKFYVVLTDAETKKLPPLPENYSDVDIMLRFIRGKTAKKRSKRSEDENDGSPGAKRRRPKSKPAEGRGHKAAAMDSLQSLFG